MALRICGDRTRTWGDNCPPRIALFAIEDIGAGFRLLWNKNDSGFDGPFDSSSSESSDEQSVDGVGSEGDTIGDVSPDVLMHDVDTNEL